MIEERKIRERNKGDAGLRVIENRDKFKGGNTDKIFCRIYIFSPFGQAAQTQSYEAPLPPA